MFRVIPFDVVGCEGTGPTIEDAADNARKALADHVMAKVAKDGDFVWPPTHVIEDAALLDQSVVRIKIEIAD